MDMEGKHQIEAAVLQILNSADIDSITEQDVRATAALILGLDLSHLPHKILVRQVIESFLLSLPTGSPPPPAEEEENPTPKIEAAVSGALHFGDISLMDGNANGGRGGAAGTSVEGATEEVVEKKPVVAPVATRVICKLSNRRDVATGGSGQNTVVCIRESFWKDGKQIPSPKSISLSSEQWSIFRNSMPAIEEAITKVESRLRSEHERKLVGDMHDRSKLETKQNGRTQSRTEVIQIESIDHKPVVKATRPRELVPIEIIRFDGKNYRQWVEHMETYLNHLQVAYVLSDPCPSAVGVPNWELGQTLSTIQKWTDDDHICRQNILNSLCDKLYGHYSKKLGTAKHLWEELKLIYLNEEHGAKVSLVKKYMEFQMVEEKSVLGQVQEFHHIADSINAFGMYVEEKFHVNVILSKLPPSWKPYGIELMKEDYLPVWMLMNHLKAEEESRGKGNKEEGLLSRHEGSHVQTGWKLGPQRIPMKKPWVQPTNHEVDRERKLKFCTICKKKGHMSEQCWFRKPGEDTTNENDNVGSANTVSTSNINGAAE